MMYKGAVKPAYNYNHYLSQRAYDIKIKKNNLYDMLDNPDKLLYDVSKKVKEDNERYKANCEFFNFEFYCKGIEKGVEKGVEK